MIDEARTLEIFGYTSDRWATHSNKKVVAVCEGCGKYRIVIKQQYHNLCHTCSMASNSVRSKLSKAAYNRQPVSDATRSKMSKSHIGNTNRVGATSSPMARRNMSEAQRRRAPPSLETRRKIGDANRLRIVSEETRGKISRNHADVSGSNNPRWAGGITPWRKIIFNTRSYKNWRNTVFKRDNYTCQLCSTRDGNITAHHVLPVRDHKNSLLVFDVTNGITLCKKCHDSINNKEYDYVDMFNSLIEAKK